MKWLLRAALSFAFGHALITACGDAAVLNPRGEDESDETGGRRGGDDPPLPGGTGGRTGSGGSKTSPPVPATGGRFGAGGSPVPGAGGSPEPGCSPPTTWDLNLFCGVNFASCSLMNQSCATTSSVKFFAEQGCGYIHITQYEQSGRVYEKVFDQFTSRLVHYSIMSDRCGTITQVGFMPNCFSWTEIPCGSWQWRDAGTSVPVDASTD